MKRFYINKDLDVLEFEAVNEWGYPRHNHNFFELTFVLKGSGQHILNDSIIDYKAGNVFFLTPKDEHEFVISEPTRFGLIKFTEQMFLEKAAFSSNSHWRKNLESVIFHSNIVAECIVHYENDKQQLFGLYALIRDELKNSEVYGRNVLEELFGALLIVLSRNIKRSIKNKPAAEITDKEKINDILTYIRQNILDNEKIKLKTIAEEFYISANYIGIYIKKHAGISVQQYVTETRVKMAERMLKQTQLSIQEIADKTGFVDASHFNKTFKKHNGVNPSQFR